MSLSVDDIIKEALAKGQTVSTPSKEEVETEPAKLASALEAIAEDAEAEAKAYSEHTEEKNEKLASIKDFVDTLNEVV